MPLKKQDIDIPIAQGVDSKTADQRIKPGKLRELKNGEFDRPGEINKRKGYQANDNTDTLRDQSTLRFNVLEKGRCLSERNDELIMVANQLRDTATPRVGWYDGMGVFSMDDTTTGWIKLGNREPVSVSVDTIYRPTDYWGVPDMYVSDGYACYAWVELTGDNNVHMSMVDLATGATVIDNYIYTPLDDVTAVHVTGFDGNFYVWASVPSENEIWVSVVVIANQFVTPFALKITDLCEEGVWDACVTEHDTHGMCSAVAYLDEDNNYPWIRWFDDATTEDDQEFKNFPGKNVITVFEADYHLLPGDVKRLVIGYQKLGTGRITALIYTTNGVYSCATEVIARDVGTARNITGCTDESADIANWATRTCFRLYVEVEEAALGDPLDSIVLSGVGDLGCGASEEVGIMYHCGLASKAFPYGGTPRVWTVYDSKCRRPRAPGNPEQPSEQNTFFLKSSDSKEWTRTDAKALYTEAGGITYRQSLSAVCEVDTNKYSFVNLRKDVQAYDLYTFDSVVQISAQLDENALPSIDLGPTQQSGGGFVGDVDGRFQELGFHLYPEGLFTIEVVAGTGAAIVRNYAVIYEWTDREGQIHRSAPSTIEASLTHDDDQVEVYSTTLCEGDYLKGSETKTVLYRDTVANPGVFHRLPDGAHKLNDRTVLYSQMIDLPYTDAMVETGELLYTTGGVLENIGPPASTIMNIRQNRILLAQSDDPTNIWYSKEKEFGIGVEFSDFLTKRVEAGGPITAMESMDDKQIVFKADQIRAFIGNGPNKLGFDGGFTPDSLVTTDAGCINRKSVVRTDMGLMFKSSKGYYLLTRNLEAKYIGAPVEGWNGETVVSGTLVKDQNQVRYLLDTGECLVYEYLTNQWSVFDGHDDAKAATVWQGNYCYLKDSAVVMEQDSTFTDGEDIQANSYGMKIKTAWIPLAGIQGLQRIYWITLLGTYKSPHTLTVKVYYDYDENKAQTKTYTATAANYTAGDPYQIRIKPKIGYGKCEAICIEIEDSNCSGTFEGAAFTSVQLTAGIKGRPMVLGTTKTR